MDTERLQLTRVPADFLRDWVAGQLQECGVPTHEVERVAQSLVQTSLWGIDSHGVARLPHYLAG
jgi:ureidoglycolate dehydrogenase (NAD+)